MVKKELLIRKKILNTTYHGYIYGLNKKVYSRRKQDFPANKIKHESGLAIIASYLKLVYGIQEPDLITDWDVKHLEDDNKIATHRFHRPDLVFEYQHQVYVIEFERTTKAPHRFESNVLDNSIMYPNSVQVWVLPRKMHAYWKTQERLEKLAKKNGLKYQVWNFNELVKETDRRQHLRFAFKSSKMYKKALNSPIIKLSPLQ